MWVLHWGLRRSATSFSICVHSPGSCAQADQSKLAMVVRIGIALNACGLIMTYNDSYHHAILKRTAGSKDRPRLLWTRGLVSRSRDVQGWKHSEETIQDQRDSQKRCVQVEMAGLPVLALSILVGFIAARVWFRFYFHPCEAGHISFAGIYAWGPRMWPEDTTWSLESCDVDWSAEGAEQFPHGVYLNPVTLANCSYIL